MQELLDKLKVAALGAMDKDIMPVLGMVLFDDRGLTCCDGQVSVTVPAEVPFEGAVPVKKMISLLSVSGDIDPAVERDGHTLRLRFGDTLLEIPCEQADVVREAQRLAGDDKPDTCETVEPPSGLLTLWRDLMPLVGTDPSFSYIYGLFVCDDKIFACNGRTAVVQQVDASLGRFCVPPRLLRVAVRVAGTPEKLERWADMLRLSFTDGTTVTGRVLPVDPVLPHIDRFTADRAYQPMPASLPVLVRQAKVIGAPFHFSQQLGGLAVEACTSTDRLHRTFDGFTGFALPDKGVRVWPQPVEPLLAFATDFVVDTEGFYVLGETEYGRAWGAAPVSPD